MKKIIIALLMFTMFQINAQAMTVEKSIKLSPIKGKIFKNITLSDGSVISVGATLDNDSFADQTHKDAYMDKRTSGDLESTALIVKYNNDGSVAFVKTFGGNNKDYFLNAVATKDGGFIALGFSYSFTGGDFSKYNISAKENSKIDITVKYDKDGKVIWAKTGGIGFLKEGKNGELYFMSKNTIYKYDNKGTLLSEKDFTDILEADCIISDIVISEDGHYYISGSRETAERKYYGFFYKIDKNINIVYKKYFEADGHIHLYNQILTQNKIIIIGQYLDCVKSGDLKIMGTKISDTKRTTGNFIISYDLDGNLVSGNIIPNTDSYSYEQLNNIGVLANGDILTSYYSTFLDYFYDPLTGKKVETSTPNQELYLYRINSDCKITYSYKIIDKNILIPNPYIFKYTLNNDSSFTLLISDTTSSKGDILILNIADKYELDNFIKSVSNLNESSYATKSWNTFKSAYDSALKTTNNVSAKQSEVNTSLVNLKNAFNSLEKGTPVTPTQEPTPTPTGTVGYTGTVAPTGTVEETISPTEKDNEPQTTIEDIEGSTKDNFKTEYIIIGSSAIVGIAVIVIIVKVKKTK